MSTKLPNKKAVNILTEVTPESLKEIKNEVSSVLKKVNETITAWGSYEILMHPLAQAAWEAKKPRYAEESVENKIKEIANSAESTEKIAGEYADWYDETHERLQLFTYVYSQMGDTLNDLLSIMFTSSASGRYCHNQIKKGGLRSQQLLEWIPTPTQFKESLERIRNNA